MPKIRFRLGLYHRPRWKSLDPLVRFLGREREEWRERAEEKGNGHGKDREDRKRKWRKDPQNNSPFRTLTVSSVYIKY